MSKRIVPIFSLCLAIVLVFLPLSIISYALDYGVSNSNDYIYKFDVTVDNPCNSNDMDKDAVNVLWFSFDYIDKNGFGSSKNEKFDMSWSNGKNKNAEFLKKYFIRGNDDEYNTSFEFSLPGKLTKMHILLNMDGGERLSFTINSISCSGKRINNNTDYVSSAYNDSNANIYCSMDSSVIDSQNSPYFESYSSTLLTQKILDSILKNPDKSTEFEGKFKDQYNAVIDLSVLDKCISVSDSEINQNLSHNDEESFYKYTFHVNVENPINLNDADYDEVEVFFIDMYYVDANGHGKTGKYKLDMSYSSELKRNKNPEYLAVFQRNNDDSYLTQFDVWLPGLLTKVECELNMSGEKLVVDFEKITLNSIAINTDRDYVSSTYYTSSAEISCNVPPSAVVVDSIKELTTADHTTLTDQYGALISKEFFDIIKKTPEKYIYHLY